MTPPTRKYGRHERLNLFCHSNRESSQSVSDLTSRIDAGAATTTTATLLPITDEHRNMSLGTVSSLSESNFLASKVDHFCPTGRWSQLVNYHGNWTKRNNSFDMDQNPRILLTVHKLDAWKSDLDTVFSGRSHVIISLLQDYRHGSSTANNLIQPIGFCIYKTKYPEKDEKKLLSKLTFVSKEMSNGGSREVIKRTNLEQGNYFIVPFCSNKEHTGEFIVRVLAEKNVKEEKSDCKLS
ncbi:calpain-A-like [Octopus sinensis]|nr:calpain-A-like [Octopus sinensis]